MHFPCKCCKISPFTCRVCTCCAIQLRIPCIHMKPLWFLYLVAVYSLIVQVVTLLLGKYTLFACANLCYPTTRLCSYVFNIFAEHLRVYTCTMECKRSLRKYLSNAKLMCTSSKTKSNRKGQLPECVCLHVIV